MLSRFRAARLTSRFRAFSTPSASQREAEENVEALTQYKQALEYVTQARYSEAIIELKRGLVILKNVQMEHTAHYRLILERLAHTCFLEKKFNDSEKYFKIHRELVLRASPNAVANFRSLSNLLLFYMHYDVQKGAALLTDIQLNDFPPLYQKELLFLQANLSFLRQDFAQAKTTYHKLLQLNPNDELTAYTLTNLATLAWMHELKTRSAPQPKQMQVIKQDRDNAWKLYKQAMAAFEGISLSDSRQKEHEMPLQNWDTQQGLRQLLSTAELLPKKRKFNDEFYKTLLRDERNGVPLSNFSEYLLLSPKLELQDVGFWFKVGLNFFERVASQDIDRQLVLYAMLFQYNGEDVMAEGLFREVMKRQEKQATYEKLMCLQFYSKLLMRYEARKSEAQKVMEEAQSLQQIIPSWYGRLMTLHQPGFKFI